MKHFIDWMEEGCTDKAQFQTTKPLMMADGTTMSIQASSFHYCLPRISTDYKNYREFEIGFPSRKIHALIPYAEDEQNPTDTVYACVPVDVIEKVIAECGGVVGYHSWEN